MTDPYTIPGGMLCTVCGLRYYSRSMGGPGICSACDCGFTGGTLIKAQRDEIDRLRGALERVMHYWMERYGSDYGKADEILMAEIQRVEDALRPADSATP